MKIVNKTKWNTKDIARLIRRVAQDELDAGKLKTARVTVEYQRSNSGVLGWCSYGSMLNPRIYMRLILKRDSINLILLAHTIAHELGHAKGIRHRDMRNVRYGYAEGWDKYYAYATEYPIGQKPVKTKPAKIDVLQKKYDRAVAMTSKWETRFKRTGTTLKRWQKQARYYEGKIAACTSAKSLINIERAPLVTIK